MQAISLTLIAALLLAEPVQSAVATEARPAIKVAVYKDGRIVADGRETDLPALREAFARLSKAGGSVWYYREGAEDEPHPNAMLVVQAIVEARLPVSLSTKRCVSSSILTSMGKMTEKELIVRDRRRDIGAELLQAVHQMKAGKATRLHQIKIAEVLGAL